MKQRIARIGLYIIGAPFIVLYWVSRKLSVWAGERWD